MFDVPFLCPSCRAPLGRERDAFACDACEARYPLLEGTIPVLVEDPLGHLARALIAYHDLASRLEGEAASVAASTLLAPAHVDELRDALLANQAVVERLAGPVAALLGPNDVAREAHRLVVERPDDPYAVGYLLEVFAYLARDWGGSDAAEREIARLVAAVRAGLPKRRGLAVVPGAGTGRLAWELRRDFESVVAMELSPAMAQCHRAATGDGLHAFRIASKNVPSPRSRIAPIDARARTPGGDGDLLFCVADASQLPFQDASVSAFVSVYFTDVLPMPTLLPELLRVLEEGGAFVHFGPLAYHFGDRGMMLSADELVHVLETSGFEVTLREWVKLDHLGMPGIMAGQSYDNLLLAAVRKGGSA